MDNIAANDAYTARERQREWSDNAYEASGTMGYGRQLRRTKGGSFLNQADTTSSSGTVTGVPQAPIMRSNTRATRYNGSGRTYLRAKAPYWPQGKFPDLANLIKGVMGGAINMTGRKQGEALKDYYETTTSLPAPQVPIPPPPPPGGQPPANWPSP